MTDPMFRGDCGRCAALCCVLLALDGGRDFAFSKPAGVACGNLTGDDRCAVHARLAASGLSGCARFDCGGAGQLVTAMFKHLDWRGEPATRRAASIAFSAVREIQTMRKLCTGTMDVRAAAIALRLEQATRSYAALLALDLHAARAEIRTILVP